ncbi:MAG TPA: nuclease-related domain-containing protein, partial [Halothiobacillus sp.]|nr:nuclease-related domain-containing protein [Halothiobacillus sp.]
KAAPLRYAGQSLDEEIQRVAEDDIFIYIMAASMAIGFAIYEWLRWYSKTPPHPVVVTIFAAIVLVYTVRKVVLAMRKLKTLRMARDGERVVGQFLEGLRETGYRVLHDIVGDNFNIDHLLIGPKGIFTIETKTMSKPARGKPEIDYDGTQILVNGFKPDRDPVVQAKAQAHWIKELVKELTGKSITVRPAVVYPGWFINQTQKTGRPDVWVLNPKALATFIDNSDGVMSDEDVRSFHAHLSRYVRNTER